MNRRFAAFILSHGRADRVFTYKSLRKHGYTGEIVILVDDEDGQVNAYRREFGDQVVVFSKREAVGLTDACDNYKRSDSVVYARNINFRIAERMGVTHFVQLDDDYHCFGWGFGNDREYVGFGRWRLSSLDAIASACCDFLDETPASSLAFAQSGDFAGGAAGLMGKLARGGWFSRKVMNTFFFRTDRPVVFRGRVNDDVNLYVECGRRGDLFVTIPRVRMQQTETQKAAGGCTDVYRDLGTYIKSFYSVMVAPSCVKVTTLRGKRFARIHHAVSWKNACPLVISETHRKPRD